VHALSHDAITNGQAVSTDATAGWSHGRRSKYPARALPMQ
jgi:hypothetical protein